MEVVFAGRSIEVSVTVVDQKIYNVGRYEIRDYVRDNVGKIKWRNKKTLCGVQSYVRQRYIAPFEQKMCDFFFLNDGPTSKAYFT